MSCSIALVAENMFVGVGRHQTLAGVERLFCLRLGQAEVMSLGDVLLWQNCIGALDGFVRDKEVSLLEIVCPPKSRLRILHVDSNEEQP